MMASLDVTSFLAERVQQLRLVVIGDVMLDRYFYGEVKRISPEAPVPVTKINKIKSVLGGAANVAANLAKLQCKVFMGGVSGDDENRALLETLLAEAGIDSSGLVRSRERRTITKLRVLGGQQQMLRMDFEAAGELLAEETAVLRQWLSKLLTQGIDGIIISDYAKGVCSDEFVQWVIAQGRERHLPVLVDPKGADWSKYRGCDFITPNVKELNEAAGSFCDNEDTAVVEMARTVKQRYDIANMVVTRSEKGMTLVNDSEVLHAPATAMEVFDVSGAGDTVAAVLLAGVAGKLSLDDAIYMANRAAGIVVAKVGTYPVHRDELLKELLAEQRQRGEGYRTLSWNEIAALAATWHASGEKIVFTNGCFDLLHVGHISYLEQARQLGRHLIVGVNTDASVKRLKGETRPLTHELDRARLLSALACVDAVVLFDEDTPTELVKLIRPDILVKGGDYSPDDVAGREYAGEVRIIAFEEGYSTTNLIAKIAGLAKEDKL